MSDLEPSTDANYKWHDLHGEPYDDYWESETYLSKMAKIHKAEKETEQEEDDDKKI